MKLKSKDFFQLGAFKKLLLMKCEGLKLLDRIIKIIYKKLMRDALDHDFHGDLHREKIEERSKAGKKKISSCKVDMKCYESSGN